MSENQTLKTIVENRLREQFQTGAGVVSRAPGRVEVLGNHTDYNEGVVLSAAIDKEVWIAAAQSPSSRCSFVSTLFDEPVVTEEIAPEKGANAWVNYPLGVYSVLKEQGYPVSPVALAIHSTVPLGAGVSSSAALEVATALALCRLFNLTIDPRDLAKICQKAENNFVGANCGLLDQFSSLFGKAGHLLFTDFRSLEHETISMAKNDITLAITLSGVTHSLVAGEYNSRRRECNRAAAFFAAKDPAVKALRDVSMQQLIAAQGELDAQSYKRALHVVGEDERVFAGMNHLKQGDITAFGRLLSESHESSMTNFENSCPELDILVDIAHTIDGVYGARLTGGGFGGAMLAMIQNDACAVFEETVVRQYKERTGRDTTVHFAKIADGAGIVE
ncbi:MAG: galactokinase [Chitinispirillaceae bacterium]|nr:galactokinase [Chitinispirillaceae bacterium]